MSDYVSKLLAPQNPPARIRGVLQELLGHARPADMTAQYNTQLSAADEMQFQTWAKVNGREADSYDYDMRGAWKSGATAAGNGHFPDTFKKPNHSTFSKESQYSGAGAEGGQWVDAGGGRFVFRAGQANVQNLGVQGLKDYFQRTEPDAKLILPGGRG